MDRVAEYRAIIKRTLEEYVVHASPDGQIEMQPVFDDQRDQYLVVDFGWSQTGRIHGTLLHVRIHDGKVWIEVDGTEEGVALKFVEAGIPKADIVLAFFRAKRRALTEFAVA